MPPIPRAPQAPEPPQEPPPRGLARVPGVVWVLVGIAAFPFTVGPGGRFIEWLQGDAARIPRRHLRQVEPGRDDQQRSPPPPPPGAGRDLHRVTDQKQQHARNEHQQHELAEDVVLPAQRHQAGH